MSSPVRRTLARVLPASLLLVVTVVGTAAQLVATAPPAAAWSPGAINLLSGGAGGPGPATLIGQDPEGIAVNGTTMYVSDPENEVVRAVDLTTGQSAIVAGTGIQGFAGDSGQATFARLSNPEGLSVDPTGSGTLYIADSGNGRIRTVNLGTGIITTFAGGGASVAETVPATTANLAAPQGVFANPSAGQVFIADTYHHKVRVVFGGNITTVAGNGTPGYNGDGVGATTFELNYPRDVEATSDGNTFVIADASNFRVRKVTGGTISTIAGTGVAGSSCSGSGTATSTAIGAPFGLTLTAAGSTLIVDRTAHCVRQVNTGGTISVLAGTGVAGYSGDGGLPTSAQLQYPTDVALVGGAIFGFAGYVITDSGNFRVRRVTTQAGLPSSHDVMATSAGNGYPHYAGDGTGIAPQYNSPNGVAVAPNGDVYVADQGNHRVRKIAADGSTSTVAGTGVSGFSGDNGPANAAQLSGPGALTFAPNGDLFIEDFGNKRVRRIRSGTITTVAGNGTSGFSGDSGPATSAMITAAAGIGVAPNGDFYIADTFNHRVRKIAGGTITTVAGTGTNGFNGDGVAANAQLSLPGDVKVDANGDPVIADSGNSRVRRITAGLISTIVGTGVAGYTGDNAAATAAKIDHPAGLAIDVRGNLFLGDGGNRIRKVNTAGIIVTVAGTGIGDYTGDGGAATAAQILVNGVALDDAGDLYFSDSTDNRIRKVNARGGWFNSVTPFRILDSRSGTGFTGPVGAGASKDLTVAGVGAVGPDAVAVVMNVTVTGASAASYLTAYPTGAPVPNAANLNFLPGQTVPNLVTVRVGAGGKVSFFNAVGSVQVIADVVGWYDDGTNNSGQGFVGITPTRILDSRPGGTGGWPGSLGAGATRDFTVLGSGGGAIPGTATSVVMNVTVTGGTAASYLQVYPKGSGAGTSANLVFAAGQTVPNLVTVGVGAGGAVTFFNQLGNVHVIADAVGYYDNTGNRFHPISPTRKLDSRTAVGGWSSTPLGPNTSRTLTLGTPFGFNASAWVMNTTVTAPTAASYLSVSPRPGTVPASTANLLFGVGQTVPNLVIVKDGTGLNDGQVDIYNQLGSVHVIGDVAGFFAGA